MNSALRRAKIKANEIGSFLDTNKLENYEILNSDGQRFIPTNNVKTDEVKTDEEE